MNTTTLYIHGWNYDIRRGESPEDQYKFWDEFVEGETIRHRWQSVPTGFYPMSVLRAWKSFQWNRYRWGFYEAVKEGERLASVFQDHAPGSINAIAHSLGSRVLYTLIRHRPELIKTALVFNGADSSKHARECITDASTQVHCVLSPDDRILRYFGRLRARGRPVGYNGLPEPHPDNWHEIHLTSDEGKNGIWNHDWSFCNPALWSRWKEIMNT
jgi:pimeloyl-ACP methyl ester carboxylesterase